MPCGCWRLATHSQQIVGGFFVGVTPSRARPQDVSHSLSATAELAVTRLMTTQSGGVLGWFWCEQVVTEWLDTNADSLSSPLVSHPVFSSFLPLLFIPPPSCPCLFLFWSVISLPLTLSSSFCFLSITLLSFLCLCHKCSGTGSHRCSCRSTKWTPSRVDHKQYKTLMSATKLKAKPTQN